ncbi:MAG: hypothetical protein ACM32J_14905 [Rhizobacter sp.]
MANERESDLVRVAAERVRAAMGGIAGAWDEVRVQFRAAEGYFSTSVGCTTAGETRPLDALHHRALFVWLQDLGRRLRTAPGHTATGFTACEVIVSASGGHRLQLLPDAPAGAGPEAAKAPASRSSEVADTPA